MRLILARARKSFISLRKNFSNKSEIQCDAHMNELPVPCTPWEPWYSQKQRLYTNQLLFGIAWWLFSFGLALYTDSIYLNCSPPKQPGPPSDMVETCVEADE